MEDPKNLSEADWRERLDPMAYQVLRQAATERPFTGELLEEHRDGDFYCKGCGYHLFQSEGKFDSHCGWPSFSAPADGAKIAELEDRSHGMVRVEVRCPRCDGHLGHVFEDGPAPTGLRYCINSAALTFQADGAEGSASDE
ncbi:MAG: peptide-methionine (R)-S-oxide reductase MsrB [Planctomycetota bacterium]